MNCKKTILKIILICLTLNCNAQLIEVFNFDSTYFKSINSINPTSFSLNNSNQILIGGHFEAIDQSLNERAPIFIKNVSNNNITFLEDSSSFVIYNFRLSAICNDENDNIYIAASVNNNKIVIKLNSDLDLIWSKRQGHHSYKDIKYQAGKLLLTGQDEDTLGNHIVLATLLDTNGILLSTKGFKSDESFNDAQKCEFSNNNILLIGSSFNSNQNERSIYISKLDSSLNFIWQKNIRKSGYEFNVSDLTLGELDLSSTIIGNFRNQNDRDTSFYIRLDKEGNILSSRKVYHDSIPLFITSNAIVDSTLLFCFNNSIISSVNQYDSIVDNYNYFLNERFINSNFIKIIANNNNIHILGTLNNDTNNFNSTHFFHLSHLISTKISCSNSITLNNKPFEVFEKSIEISNNYFGNFVHHPVTVNKINIIKFDSTICTSTLDTNTTNIAQKTINSAFRIIFSNPNNEEIYFKSIDLNTSKYDYQLFDMTGKLISNQKLTNNYIPSHFLKNGIYFISISLKDSYLGTYKILINHDY